MGLIDGDDGLPADEVGVWAKEKHTYLKRYLDIACYSKNISGMVKRWRDLL